MEVEELGYNRGYSVIHFVLMYMIARCINLYEDDIIKTKSWIWVLGYLLSTIVIIFSFVAGVKWCWNYSSPIVVLSSVCTFLPFLYKTFYNKVINWIASGTLAVYIIHVTNRAKTILESVDRNLLDTKSYPMYLILISVVIFITFIVSTLYGIVCNYISSRATKGIDKRTKSVLSFE
jgi:uncharacterized membrane protein YcfT